MRTHVPFVPCVLRHARVVIGGYVGGHEAPIASLGSGSLSIDLVSGGFAVVLHQLAG